MKNLLKFRKSFYKESNPLSKLIESQYVSKLGFGKDISRKILKMDKDVDLFYIGHNLSNHYNPNITHLSLVVGRLIDLEKSKKKIKKDSKKKNQKFDKLKDNIDIYSLIKKLEENVYKMNDVNINYILAKIIEAQKIGIFLNSLFFKVIDHLLEDDNYLLLDRNIRINVFIIIVKCQLASIFDKNDENVKFLLKELLKDISKMVSSDLLEKEFYFRLLKYYYLYDFINFKKINHLNKRIWENKKEMLPSNYYYWFFLNTKIPKNNKFIYLILKDILNKQIFKPYSLIKTINLCEEIHNLKFEDQKLLKIASLDNFHKNINNILIFHIEQNKIIHFLKELLLYIRNFKIKNIDYIFENLKIILRDNLFHHTENFFIYLVFFENEIEIKRELLEKLVQIKIYQGLDPKIYFSLYNYFLNYEIDLEIYKKKGFKIMIKKYYKFENEKDYKNFVNLLNEFIKNDKNYLTYYLENLKKYLNKIEIFNNEKKVKSDQKTEKIEKIDKIRVTSDRFINNIENNLTKIFLNLKNINYFYENNPVIFNDNEELLNSIFEIIDKKIILSFLTEENVIELQTLNEITKYDKLKYLLEELLLKIKIQFKI